MLCPECERRRVAEGHDTCYPCHFRSLSFGFRGASYGRATFHDQTIGERQREAVSTNSNVEPI